MTDDASKHINNDTFDPHWKVDDCKGREVRRRLELHYKEQMAKLVERIKEHFHSKSNQSKAESTSPH